MPDLKADVSRLLNNELHSASSYMRDDMWSMDAPLGASKHPGLAESTLEILEVIALVLN